MNDQGLGVPDVGEVRGEDAAVDKGDASCIMCMCLSDELVASAPIYTSIVGKEYPTYACAFLPSRPPLTPKLSTGPNNPGRKYCLARSCDSCSGNPG